MNRYRAIGLLFILVSIGAFAQKTKKHNDVSAVFQNAHFVYVEAADGDAMKPGLYAADRQAIFDVQDGLRNWNRYALASRREEADLVLVVRIGRIAGVQPRTGISAPRPGNPQGRTPGQDPSNGDNIGAETEVGPENDMLRVYIVSDGKLSALVWMREMKDGLDAPPVELLQQLRTAVERAYPSQPPAPKQTKP
jgi:hypothetical protein